MKTSRGRPCDNRGEEWSDVSAGQGVSGMAGSPQKLGEWPGADSPQEALPGTRPCWQLDLRLPAPGLRKHTFIVLSPQFVGICCSSPRKPTCKAAAAAKSLHSCLTLCDPIDGSPPGSPVRGILQARTLEWVAISFSNAWEWKVKVKSLSRVWLFETPWTAAHQAPLSMGFSRQETCKANSRQMCRSLQPALAAEKSCVGNKPRALTGRLSTVRQRASVWWGSEFLSLQMREATGGGSGSPGPEPCGSCTGSHDLGLLGIPGSQKSKMGTQARLQFRGSHLRSWTNSGHDSREPEHGGSLLRGHV